MKLSWDQDTWEIVGMVLGTILVVTIAVLFLVGVVILGIEVYKQMKNSSNKQEKKYDFKWTPRMTIGAALMAPAVIALIITFVIAVPASMLYV